MKDLSLAVALRVLDVLEAALTASLRDLPAVRELEAIGSKPAAAPASDALPATHEPIAGPQERHALECLSALLTAGYTVSLHQDTAGVVTVRSAHRSKAPTEQLGASLYTALTKAASTRECEP